MTHSDYSDLISRVEEALDAHTDGLRAPAGLADRARSRARRQTATRAIGVVVPGAAVAATAVVLASGSASSPSHTQPAPQVRTAAFIARHVRAAIAREASVIETEGMGDGFGPDWMYVDPQTGVQTQRSVGINPDGSLAFANQITATPVNNVLHFHTVSVNYDNHTWDEDDSVASGPEQPSSGPAGLSIDSTPQDVEQALSQDTVTKGAPTTIDGEPVFTLKLAEAHGSDVTLYVDTDSYQPVQEVVPDSTQSDPAGTYTMDWLPGTAANIALTQLTVPSGYTQTSPTS